MSAGQIERVAAPAAVIEMASRRHHVVEASAGTGKTYLIEHRVLDLVIRAGAAIESILVVTFTEKATAELRRRIRAKLEALLAGRAEAAAPGEPSWTLDDETRARLRAALLGFDRAAIFTIHGFCNRVASDSGFAAGRALRPEAVAGRVAFSAAFADAVRRELAVLPGPRALLGAWLESGRTAAALKAHLWGCLERGGDIGPGLDPDRLGAAIEAAARQLETGDPFAGLELHPRTLSACRDRLPAVSEAVARAAAADLAEEQLAALSPVAGELRWLAERGVLADLAAAAVDLDAAIASAFVPRLRRAAAEHKRRRGQIDFGDMLAQVWDSLEGEGGGRLAAELRGRYPFALIDEFQDTDELQWNIFRRLYLESPGEPGWLTVVGDPKQAIYGFRGADLHTYLRATRELTAAGAARTVLAVNYRSTPALLGAVGRLVSADFFSAGIEAPAEMRSGSSADLRGEDGAAAAAVLITELTAEGKLKRDEVDRLCAESVAAEIAALVDGAPLTVTRPDQPPRRLGAGDVMVLARTGAECEAVAGALRRRGVATSLHQQRDLLATREAAELLAVLRGIDNPRSRSARMAALATRFFDLPLAALAGLADSADGSEAVAQLYAWKALADRFEFESLIPAVLADSRIIERELALGRGKRAITNLEHLAELVIGIQVRSRCSLAELCQRLAARIDLAVRGEIAEPVPLRLESDREAVQLMTVHAAKGLEAPVVFVVGGIWDRSVRQRRVHVYHDEADRRRVHIGRPDEALEARIAAELRGEDERLMYVALTRAAARLHLFHLPAAVFGVNGAYAPVNDRLPALAGDADVEWRRIGEPDGERAAASRPLAIAAPPPAVDEPALPEEIERLCRERAGPVLTSYTRIKRESPELAGRAGRDQPGVGGGIGGLDGREVGLLLHWILERAPLAAAGAGEPEAVATDPDLERLLGAGMDAFGLELAHRDEIAALVAKALTAELSVGQQPLGNLSAADGAAREVEFTYPVDRDGALRGYVSGYIDVLFEKAGKIYVLDWKSDALLDYGTAALAEHTRASYQVQSELYSLALARMVGLDLSPDGDDSGYERFGGLIYCYLRAPVSIGERPTPGELRRRAAALATSEVTWQR